MSMAGERFTEEERQFILEHYKGTPNQELTKMFNEKFNSNRPVHSIKCFKKNNKLDSGLDGRFKPGCTPPTKGRKWSEYMPEKSQENSRKTQFKKGNVPPNLKPAGTERISVDGYYEVKVPGKKKWMQKARLVWERHHGEIPRNHIIIHKNGDSLDDRIENLELLSRRELLQLNRDKMMKKGAETNETAILIAKIKAKTAERKKKC